MPYDKTGAWVPARRNSQGIKCRVCNRIFAGELVPTDHVCRDCRPDSPTPEQQLPL